MARKGSHVPAAVPYGAGPREAERRDEPRDGRRLTVHEVLVAEEREARRRQRRELQEGALLGVPQRDKAWRPLDRHAPAAVGALHRGPVVEREAGKRAS